MNKVELHRALTRVLNARIPRDCVCELELLRDYIEESEPVRYGRWILSDDKNWLTCPFCDADVDVSCGAPFFYVDNDVVSHINFCPNCGSKNRMDGESK